MEPSLAVITKNHFIVVIVRHTAKVTQLIVKYTTRGSRQLKVVGHCVYLGERTHHTSN